LTFTSTYASISALKSEDVFHFPFSIIQFSWKMNWMLFSKMKTNKERKLQTAINK